jgi:hypothetical protein
VPEVLPLLQEGAGERHVIREAEHRDNPLLPVIVPSHRMRLCGVLIAPFVIKVDEDRDNKILLPEIRGTVTLNRVAVLFSLWEKMRR